VYSATESREHLLTVTPSRGTLLRIVLIQLAKCRLRTLEERDATSIAQNANDREIWLNLRDRFPHPYSEENAREYIELRKSVHPLTSLGIDVNGDIVGMVSLMPGSDIERINCEIGYWLGREFWGRGIVTEAVRAMTKHAFAELKMERVFAVPFTRNPASCRILEKCDYVREGTMRRSAIKDGLVLDQYLYARYR
jgi:[ribosomal protein S5]-alanine N-acetyltransferase